MVFLNPNYSLTITDNKQEFGSLTDILKNKANVFFVFFGVIALDGSLVSCF